MAVIPNGSGHGADIAIFSVVKMLCTDPWNCFNECELLAAD